MDALRRGCGNPVRRIAMTTEHRVVAPLVDGRTLSKVLFLFLTVLTVKHLTVYRPNSTQPKEQRENKHITA
jgi:hypothetical protein